MKKILAAAVLAAALLVGNHAIRTATEQIAIARPENIYPMCGVVVEVDWNADTVMIEDAAGLTWTFYHADDWVPGDVAALIMYDWGTPSILDDEILDVKYCGTAETLDYIAHAIDE